MMQPNQGFSMITRIHILGSWSCGTVEKVIQSRLTRVSYRLTEIDIKSISVKNQSELAEHLQQGVNDARFRYM